MERGASWTTNARFPGTTGSIPAARAAGVLVVEMEAMYAFAWARDRAVLCFARVIDWMGQDGGFENGATASLALARAVVEAWLDGQG